MELESLALQEKNKVMQSYNNDKEFLHTFFDYENEESSYPDRLKELAGRTFERRQLAETIRSFMEPFGISANANTAYRRTCGKCSCRRWRTASGYFNGTLIFCS